MPLLQVNVLPGYSEDVKQQLCSELTWTIAGVTGAAGDGISVWIHEVPARLRTRPHRRVLPRHPGGRMARRRGVRRHPFY